MTDEAKAIAEATLRELCTSRRASSAARAAAARTLLELAGVIGPARGQMASENKELHELTRAELDAEIARLQGTTGAPVGSTRSSRARLTESVKSPAPRTKTPSLNGGNVININDLRKGSTPSSREWPPVEAEEDPFS